MQISDYLVVGTILLALVLLFQRRVRESENWKATITPLASIIGSGFLVVAPLLYSHFNRYSPIAMLILVVFSYAIGSVIRGNILAESANPHHERISSISRVVLFVAYIVSVAFYIKLLSAFLIRGFGISEVGHEDLARIISTVILLLIGLRGFLKGFGGLELFEEYAVSGKLAVIAGLIFGLAFFNIEAAQSGNWELANGWQPSWNGLRVLMGSLIVIQGFETSEFIHQQYSAQIRVKTMRHAQIISGLIYLVFVSLMMVISPGAKMNSDTAVIDLSAKVSVVLPTFLVFAAVLSQFSAATADTLGAGGIVTGLIQKLSKRLTYLPVIFCAIALVWLTDIFQIIAIASRCFALFYALECARSVIRNFNISKTKAAWHMLLVIALVLCAIFGIPAEV
jgi:hypothetical protein